MFDLDTSINYLNYQSNEFVLSPISNLLCLTEQNNYMADEKNAAPTEEFNDDGTKNPDYVASAGSEGADDTKKTDKTDDTENKDDKGADEDDGEFDDDIEKNPPKPLFAQV